MILKPRPERNIEERSPWADQQVRPTVSEVARAYPGVALTSILFGFTLGVFPTAFILFALNSMIDTVAGPSLIDYSSGEPTPGGAVLIVVTLVLVTLGVAWVDMYGLIRGWWTDGGAT